MKYQDSSGGSGGGGSGMSLPNSTSQCVAHVLSSVCKYSGVAELIGAASTDRSSSVAASAPGAATSAVTANISATNLQQQTMMMEKSAAKAVGVFGVLLRSSEQTPIEAQSTVVVY